MEKKYPKGVFAFKPKASAPDFIVTNIVIKKEEFLAWLETDMFLEEEIRLDVLISKDRTKHNVQVNEWKKSA